MEQELVGLNSEQQANYALFQEVTASGRDAHSAVRLLQSSGWNVDRAVQLHWDATGDEEVGIALPVLGPASRTAAAGEQNPFGVGGEFAAPLLEPSSSARTPNFGNSSSSSRSSLMGRIRRWLKCVTCSFLDILRAFFAGSSPARAWPASDSEAGPSSRGFRRSLLEAYGEQLHLPRFFEGSFSQAVEAAHRDLKLLAVYLHSAPSQQSQALCTEVLANEAVRAMLDSRFVLWGGDVARAVSQTVARMLHAHAFPYLCVILPVSYGEVRVIGNVSGAVEIDAAVALLTACLEEMESHRAEMIARTDQQFEDRLLRQEQDREYQEALEMDRLREEERRRQEAEQRELQHLEEEKRLQEQQCVEKLEAQRQALQEQRRQKAAALGAEDPEATARISLRLPAGQRIQRKFSPDALLGDVYDWAEVAAHLPENAEKGLEVPRRFVLKTCFPSRGLTEKEQSIEALHLAGTNILLAEVEDEEVQCS